MKTSQRFANTTRRTLILASMAAIVLFTGTGCTHLMMMTHLKSVPRPGATEFGLGPRVSSYRQFTATLQPVEPLRTRQLQTIRVAVTGVDGRAVEDAAISIDGGMPQHGHGLPTRPRVTKHLGGGVYEIEGVRFNMGGWWEFKLAINSAAGTDTVTFNLSL